jgi:hypothetical protein
MQAFISINQSLDIEVKSGQVVMTKPAGNEVTISMKPSTVNADGFGESSQIMLKASPSIIREVKSIIDPVLDYHGIDAIVSGGKITISDADYLADDTINAIELAVKGMNSYLK